MATMMNPFPQRQRKHSLRPKARVRVLSARDARSYYAPLLMFLMISILACSGQSLNFFALIPEGLRPFLGDPPPVRLISLTLAIYFLSMVVINVHGMVCGGQPRSIWFHVVCRSVFYLLYFTAGALPANLPAVLVAGSILLLLEFLWLRNNQRRLLGHPV